MYDNIKLNNFSIIGDVHLGYKNFNNYEFEETKKFFINYIKYLKDNDINTIIQLGDFFDNRKNLDINFIYKVKNEILPLFKGFRIITILGNHDIYYRNRLYPNIYDVFQEYLLDNWVIIQTPSIIDGYLFIPWVINPDEIKEYINNHKDEYHTVFGHFEFKGFKMMEGYTMKQSKLNPSDFGKDKKIYTGHFHLHQEKNNVIYVGSIRQFNWGDLKDCKLFYICKNNNCKKIYNNWNKKYIEITIRDSISNVFYCNTRESIENSKLLSYLTSNEHLNNHFKFIIDEKGDLDINELIYNLKEINEDLDYIVQDNTELSNVIGSGDEEDSRYNMSTVDYIIKVIDEKEPRLSKKLLKLLGRDEV